jgi:hypothetical protein
LKIRAGYNIAFECFQATPITLMLSVHPERTNDLLSGHYIALTPSIWSRDVHGSFGMFLAMIVCGLVLIVAVSSALVVSSGSISTTTGLHVAPPKMPTHRLQPRPVEADRLMPATN